MRPSTVAVHTAALLPPEARKVVSWDASVASQRRLAAAAEREKELTHGSVIQKAVSVDDEGDRSEGARLPM
jgi:hypothetical protein